MNRTFVLPNSLANLRIKWIQLKKSLQPTTVQGPDVQYHVVEGKIYSKDLKNGMTLPSVEGTPIRINIYNVRKHEDPRVTLLDK